ncbi:substrate-binding domain-containing protein [Bifidobacterium tibiigranuli]|jgi:Ca-activated chloride channel family protein|uniref:substrate-binding domain-containing protein n=1 Tax=Bifidobacterium tibiigranuli TaxID=2172043 RepID=UPI002356AB14|nr:substrate-binding domain-containing protein [Bifidobacterium tibiigranuli]MCI1210504.1 substrate-binding and VWA domain-containing protein [Bifidobacterium tibiigranuli]MCI1220984.1 substrate-binding and VWA domain-containing protein [Bifidobacterium tibiigranuli]MCI1232120.1 substrate-binding and VWA domain-containing protein [Bifidobacterium tibiigranuli]
MAAKSLMKGFAVGAVLAAVMTLGSCFGTTPPGKANPAPSPNLQTFTPANGSSSATLSIASGSENGEVSNAIQKASDESGVAITMHYMGSLDIMNALEQGGSSYDAVWPASSMWISMGDTKHIVKDAASTSTTPIVFGVAQSKAMALGWAKPDGSTRPVSTSEVMDAVKAKQLKFSMTSATQSNSGASAYLAFLTALSGKQQALSVAELNDPALQASAKTLLSGVDRSSGSSDWLKDMVVSDPGRVDAMVNYESLVIAANRQLTGNGHDPLLAVYPSDGIAISDSPLGYVDRGQKLDGAFAKFAKALHSKESQKLFEQAGRRTGLGGTLANPNDAGVKSAFRADWGINAKPDALKAIAMPSADVISKALDLYQTALRKPSYTIWVVDYSGSMGGNGGRDGVVKGLNAALDPAQAKRSMIQPAPNDVNVFIPFDSSPQNDTVAKGTDTGAILDRANALEAGGGTDIYSALDKAIRELPADPSQYTTAIVAMTDGQSETGSRDSFMSHYRALKDKPPIFSIMFGDADPSQLEDLAGTSNAKVFDGRNGNLASVFRTVKGYN